MKNQTGLAEINGTRLYYEIAGSGHPLVLIHGFTLDTRMWDDQFELFSQHYQVVRYDVRGFGKSMLPGSESYAHADDLRALLEYLGIEFSHVLGLSMGGSIAIDFALSYPELTTALITVDSALGGFQFVQLGQSLELIWATGKEAGAHSATKLWLEHDLFKPALESSLVGSRLKQIVDDYSGWHWTNENPSRGLDPPAAQRLHEIRVPTLAIVGERDLVDFHTIADTLQQSIFGARKVIMPGVGHMSNMEAPEKFNEVVLGFLSDI